MLLSLSCPAAFPDVCSLLPCWSPLVSFSPPCGPLSWLVLVAPPSVYFWFVLLAWPVLLFVWFVWFRCVVRPWLVSLFCGLLLVASPHVILDRYARIFDFPCTTKAFILIGLVCLSADWTGSLVLLTSPVHLVFTLAVLCDYPQSTEVTKDGCRLLTLIIHTHPPL